MRYYFAIFLATCCLLLVSCKKEAETTGLLKVTLSSSVPGRDRIYIFAAENQNYPIFDFPQGRQSIPLNAGNYLISWSDNPDYLGSEAVGFQIRVGKTTEAYYNLGWQISQ